jgi:hypothetical protein
MAQFFHMIAKICMGVSMTQKRPLLWLNTDLDRYLRDQDGSGGEATAAPGAPLQTIADDSAQDRRRATRQLLSGFAVVHTLDPDGRKGRYRVAQLRDISTTGIGLRLNSTEPESFTEGREFEVLFQFSDQGKPLHMACTACRKALDEAGVIIGAVFRNPLGSLAEISC